MKKDIQILIIPDVHGRTFWKDAVEAHSDVPTVFLGDYLDQYAQEKITDKEAMDVFMYILAHKAAHPDSVHLLLGNHDMAYIDQRFGCGRHKYLDEDVVGRVYRDRIDLFELAFDAEVGGKRFLFTHAGVTKGWLSCHRRLFADGLSAKAFSDLWHGPKRRNEAFLDALTDVSILRWGQSKFGSPLWADLQETMGDKLCADGVVQVFGHSQQDVEPACLKDRAYCLDCRRVFYIDSQGDVRDYITDKVVGDSRYIFLDIDGVMTSWRTGYWFDPECFARLGRILDRTGADIVITSSWKGLDVKETIGYLTDTKDPHVGEHPFPFADRIVGITRDWPVVDDDYTRGKEIDVYLKHHSCSSYVIIDDVQDFLPEQQPCFVHTRDSVGLDDADTERSIKILLGDVLPV